MRNRLKPAGLCAFAWLIGMQISSAQSTLTPDRFTAEYEGELQVRDEMVPLTPISGLSSTLLSRTFRVATPFADNSNGYVFTAKPKWYWRNLDSEGKPIRETGFLEQVTSFQLHLGYWAHEMANGDDGDGPMYGAHLRYVGQRVPYVVGLYYEHQEFDLELDNPPVNLIIDATDYATDMLGLSLGYYVLPYLEVGAFGESGNIDELSLAPVQNSSLYGFEDLATFGLYLKGVSSLGPQFTVNYEVKFSHVEATEEKDIVVNDDKTVDNDFIHLGGDLYFTEKFSFGGEYITALEDLGDTGQFTIEINMNFSARFGVRAAFMTVIGDANDDGESVVFIGVTGRH